MKKNKGYTLIEMIIVIAIMAILTAVAFVTLGVIHQAKCNAAVNSLDNQIGSLWIKTKAISQGKTQTSPTSSEPGAAYPLCMQLCKNVDSTDDIRDGSYEIILGYEDGTNFIQKEKVEALTDIVSIKYTETSGHAEQRHSTLTSSPNADGTTDNILIEFNKSDGSVKYGAGTYEVIYNNSTVASIYLDSITGNHYIK